MKKAWYKKWWVIILVLVGILTTFTIIFPAPEETATDKEPQKKTASQSVLEATETKSVKTITETENISFKTEKTTDTNLEKGKTNVIQTGRNGKKEIKYEVTYEDGVEVSRKKISETIVVKPINKIIAEGTYEAPKATTSNCDPNYSGCVPIASDVDCAGGSGNGPAYVVGPVRVIGYDIYGLDRDGDGYGCE